MKIKQLIFGYWTVILICSCQSNSKPDATVTTQENSTQQHQANVPKPGSTCYQGVMGQDTFRLTLHIVAEKATGTLAYRFKEKDASYGNIAGDMRGDTLFAIFTYMSEGSRSEREVAFLVSATDAVEGYGTLMEKNDRMVFLTNEALTFGGVRLQKADCSTLPFDGLPDDQQ